ncbi:MAG: hypothetical protein R3284_02865 [Rubricoccaceae bacterium]|nr:hypothetical protein [Rubricoccaceae bacterium]
MKTSPTPTLALLITISVSGCNITHSPVAVYGGSHTIIELDGEWEGHYTSRDTGRSGGIYFNLSAEDDTAVGEVVMTPHPRYESGGTREGEVHGGIDREYSQVLTITFVRALDGLVSGQLDNYIDPDCGCTLSTSFVGEVNGDRIEGTFISQSREHNHINRGTWEVTRKRL